MNTRQPLDLRTTLGAALAPGVGTAVAMWIVWWIFHLPGFELPHGPLAALLALTMLVSLTAWTGWSGRRAALRAGAAAGLLAGLLNLLLLGSKIVDQATSTAELAETGTRLRPGAVLGLFTFLIASGVVGAAAGLLGGVFARRDDPPAGPDTLAGLAVVAAVAFFPLIVVGGAVTSTESGMAVPDAVTTYGAVSFLFPLSLMAGEWGDPRIFLEHTHRLFGSLVGLVTLLVAIWTWAVDHRRRARVFAITVFGLVCVQGILGALRVGENSPWLATLHGVLGQLVFAAAVILAASVSATGRAPEASLPGPTETAARKGKAVAVVALVCTVLQLSFGAMSRHLGVGHATWTHAVFAVFVAMAIGLLGAVLQTSENHSNAGRGFRRIGGWLIALIAVQFLLGFVVLWEVTQSSPRPIPLADELATAPPPDLVEAIVATLHQTIGAAILALVALGVYWTRRLAPPAGHPVPAVA